MTQRGWVISSSLLHSIQIGWGAKIKYTVWGVSKNCILQIRFLRMRCLSKLPCIPPNEYILPYFPKAWSGCFQYYQTWTTHSTFASKYACIEVAFTVSVTCFIVWKVSSYGLKNDFLPYTIYVYCCSYIYGGPLFWNMCIPVQ